MICPDKMCRQEIPDDSLFCDQCGTRILRCAKCGSAGMSKFCIKCGGLMVLPEAPPAVVPQAPIMQTPVPQSPVVQTPAMPVPQSPAAPTPATPVPQVPTPSAATVIVSFPSEKFFLCHPDGWKLETADGDILGRTAGPHTGRLGVFPVISSNHAKITRQGGGWFITDLKSTNGTYLNGVRLEPNVPTRIKQDDVVILANVTFTGRKA